MYVGFNMVFAHKDRYTAIFSRKGKVWDIAHRDVK